MCRPPCRGACRCEIDYSGQFGGACKPVAGASASSTSGMRAASSSSSSAAAKPSGKGGALAPAELAAARAKRAAARAQRRAAHGLTANGGVQAASGSVAPSDGGGGRKRGTKRVPWYVQPPVVHGRGLVVAKTAAAIAAAGRLGQQQVSSSSAAAVAPRATKAAAPSAAARAAVASGDGSGPLRPAGAAAGEWVDTRARGRALPAAAARHDDYHNDDDDNDDVECSAVREASAMLDESIEDWGDASQAMQTQAQSTSAAAARQPQQPSSSVGWRSTSSEGPSTGRALPWGGGASNGLGGRRDAIDSVDEGTSDGRGVAAVLPLPLPPPPVVRALPPSRPSAATSTSSAVVRSSSAVAAGPARLDLVTGRPLAPALSAAARAHSSMAARPGGGVGEERPMPPGGWMTGRR